MPTDKTKRRVFPAPGEAPMPAADAAALLRRNATDPGLRDRPAVKFDDRVWTHAEFVGEAHRWANLFHARKPKGRALHVGVLLDNTPDYLFALAGAALSGSAIVGVNPTRRGEHLLRDIEHTDCGLVITEPCHAPLLEPITDRLPATLMSHRYSDAHQTSICMGGDIDDALSAVDGRDAGIEPGPGTLWALILTSGTSDAPKAVICTQRRLLVTGSRISIILQLDADDVGYLCMPLFHSNSLMVGWATSIVVAASVGLARRFSASRWLVDIRRYGTTYWNYTGKPIAYIMATPERPAFARRFDVDVIDVYGATEGGVHVHREVGDRAGALGLVGENVKVVDEQGNERALARFDAAGRLVNADECVGEIVNVSGAGPFEGYYNNPDANERTLRFGWYWTGDLGYLDGDRYLYFAGRNAEWVRVDGENFPAQPIENAIARHPDVIVAAVYGVPDDQAGDQVMVGIVLSDGATFDPAGFAHWLDAQETIGPKWRPRYVRLLRDVPTTGTNKIIKRALAHQKIRSDRTGGDAVYVRGRRDDGYRRFTRDDEAALRASFEQHGRERFWDL
ncbi:MAG: acyl-CoA synthetase [Actinobacteria bacterium]|nr:MAG: acyl-CoA synthetase [Actinomycetota bacterium]